MIMATCNICKYAGTPSYKALVLNVKGLVSMNMKNFRPTPTESGQ